MLQRCIVQGETTNASQNCVVVIASDGVSVRMEDESKTLQSSVFLRPELFAEYGFPGTRRVFGVCFNLLLDTLQVFSSMVSAELEIRYPGSNNELLFQMGEDNVCIYATLNSLEMTIPGELADYWQEPASYFIAQGGLLKEAVEDVEWPGGGGGSVTLQMTRNPLALSIKTRGQGSLEIDLPVMALSGVMVTEATVVFCYSYRQLQAAFCHIPQHKDTAQVSTKVCVDANGLMKVNHMVSLARGGHVDGNMEFTAPSTMHTQNTGRGGSRTGVVTFFLLPFMDDADG